MCMMSHRNNWMPSMAMPPLGFGVVMPQPGGGAGNNPTPYGQSQQSLAYTHLPIGGQECTRAQWQLGMVHQSVPAAMYSSQQQQQQWFLAQRRAAGEQKAMHEKWMKQRQFEEQRQRLKEFESRKKKGTFSVDAMIQDIFSREEQSTTKAKTTKDHGAAGHLGCENESKMVSGVPLNPYQPDPLLAPATPNFTPFNTTPQPSFAPDHKASEVGGGFHLPTTPLPTAFTPVPRGHLGTANPSGDPRSRVGTVASQNLGAQDPMPTSSTQKTPLGLPAWLTDPEKLPLIYSQASGLVRSHGDWVDTKGAYMLLMRTRLPPPILGVLWEMVNRTQPGCLRVAEFHALLALVACAQGGQRVPGPEALASLSSPVHPFIDHPTLLASARQGSQENPEKTHGKGAPTSLITRQPPYIHTKVECTPGASTQSGSAASDPDDFDDFVSATVVPSTTGEDPGGSVIPSHLNSVEALPHSKRAFPPLLRNLPTLGSSPPLIRRSLEDDDEFDDFQSAAPPPTTTPALTLPSPPLSVVPLEGEPVATRSATSHLSPPVSAPTRDAYHGEGRDRYAAFRDLSVPPEGLTSGLQGEEEDGFGNFCSSVPDWHCDDITDKKGAAVVGSAEVPYGGAPAPVWDEVGMGGCIPQPPPSLPSLLEGGSSDSSNYITANTSADTSNDDDDFGDFVGPADLNAEGTTSGVSNCPKSLPADPTSETQSVASLELPSLELTVNLAQSEQGLLSITPQLEVAVPLAPASSKTDDFVGIESDLERPCQSLCQGDKSATCQFTRTQKTSQEVPLDDPLPLGTSSLPLTDRYSIIRAEESSKVDLIDPRVDLWKRCLEGCGKLLEQGVAILTKLGENTAILEQVVATSQMKDYLSNLCEVWRVCRRIETSNRRGGPNHAVEDLSTTVRQLWTDLSVALGNQVHKVVCFQDSFQPIPDEGGDADCCNLCLSDSGEVSLVYGGRAYHSPCANLWLNVVDLTLPSLSHSRPTLL